MVARVLLSDYPCVLCGSRFSCFDKLGLNCVWHLNKSAIISQDKWFKCALKVKLESLVISSKHNGSVDRHQLSRITSLILDQPDRV